MNITYSDLIPTLSEFNPWWIEKEISDLPRWHRTVYKEIVDWTISPPAPRAIMLSGARQVGKTTLLMQCIQELLEKHHVPPENILYATFDHPLMKLAGLQGVLEAWRLRKPKGNGVEYLFLDELQFIKDWGTWVKHQVDFDKNRRIIFTGSSMPLLENQQESGVGRWHTIKVPTLSFSEYLQIRKTNLPAIPKGITLETFPTLNANDISLVKELFKPYEPHFHEYLLRGGFPQTALVNSLSLSQKLIREDIIDKVLKRDMTALFGVRNIIELENTFLYLCMHDGGILDIQALANNLGVSRPSATNFINLLESCHLLYKLQPYNFGKEVLKTRLRVFLADASIAPAVMIKGTSLLSDPAALGHATETAVFKHIYNHFLNQHFRLGYLRGNKDREVDIIVETGDFIIPFEVKYSSQKTDQRDFQALIELCKKQQVPVAYIVTRSFENFGPFKVEGVEQNFIQIPASLLCYWL